MNKEKLLTFCFQLDEIDAENAMGDIHGSIADMMVIKFDAMTSSKSKSEIDHYDECIQYRRDLYHRICNETTNSQSVETLEIKQNNNITSFNVEDLKIQFKNDRKTLRIEI